MVLARFGADEMKPAENQKKPDWLKMKIPGGDTYGAVKRTVNGLGLHTVCREAACPNLGECWGAGTAAFMILGDTCTRGCRFCAVDRHADPVAVDPSEPERVRAAAEGMKLSHAVVTSVTRDDLHDGGASVFAATVRALQQIRPQPPTVELLIPDFVDSALFTVLDASPEVSAHNVETTERLTPLLRHPRFSFERSIQTLRQSKVYRKDIFTKSSIMLGLGETQEEIKDTMEKLLEVGVDILVIGQYLRPTRANIGVERYLPMDTFENLAALGKSMGFGFTAAHPLARTSYRAKEALLALRAESVLPPCTFSQPE